MRAYTDARLVLPDRIVPNGFIVEHEGKIVSVGEMAGLPQYDTEVFACDGLYLCAGFVDLHSHGGGGHDFMDGTADGFIKAAQSHLSHGTTTLLPTTLTSSDDDLFRAIDAYKETLLSREPLPYMPGLHLEGPYFNPAQSGAQNPAYMRDPNPSHYEKIMEYSDGRIARWTVAPELDGALEMGRRLSRQGVLLSIGHSDATYQQVIEAFDNGYTHLTHYYSCMSGIVRKAGFRILGVIESGYLIDGLTIELIADGLHLPPDLLRLILRIKDHESICLVTDSMRGAGMPEGPSTLGSYGEGLPVIIEDGIAKLPDRSAFAGSVATADRLVRTMVREAGLPLHEAAAMMTRIPSRIAGLDRKGILAPGKDADFVLFDDDIQVRRVVRGGRDMGTDEGLRRPAF